MSPQGPLPAKGGRQAGIIFRKISLNVQPSAPFCFNLTAFFIASDKNEDGLVDINEYLKASLAHELGNLDLNDHKVY